MEERDDKKFQLYDNFLMSSSGRTTPDSHRPSSVSELTTSSNPSHSSSEDSSTVMADQRKTRNYVYRIREHGE